MPSYVRSVHLTRSGRIEYMMPLSIYRVDKVTAKRINERFRKEFERQ